MVTFAFQSLYICLLSSVVQFFFIIGYTDDHTLLKVIPVKEDVFKGTKSMNHCLPN